MNWIQTRLDRDTWHAQVRSSRVQLTRLSAGGWVLEVEGWGQFSKPAVIVRHAKSHTFQQDMGPEEAKATAMAYMALEGWLEQL